MDQRQQLFLDKPELVGDWPAWMLGPGLRQAQGADPGLAVVEIAGRDSVAAALKAVAERGFTRLLPTYVYTGTEHGPWSSVDQAVARLRRRLPAGVEVLPLMLMGSPCLWRALNGRFLGELARRYGFSPVCVGCHAYLHALRLPLARFLGNPPIIAGERESHDGRIKLNQTSQALNAYQELMAGFGVQLLLPLRQVAQGAEVERLLGRPWAEGGEQLGCAFSGNYLDAQGQARWEPEGLRSYLEEFALPLLRGCLTAHLAGEAPDPASLSQELFQTL